MWLFSALLVFSWKDSVFSESDIFPGYLPLSFIAKLQLECLKEGQSDNFLLNASVYQQQLVTMLSCYFQRLRTRYLVAGTIPIWTESIRRNQDYVGEILLLVQKSVGSLSDEEFCARVSSLEEIVSKAQSSRIDHQQKQELPLNGCPLKCLDLSRNGIGMDGAFAIADLILVTITVHHV